MFPASGTVHWIYSNEVLQEYCWTEDVYDGHSEKKKKVMVKGEEFVLGPMLLGGGGSSSSLEYVKGQSTKHWFRV